MTASNGQFVLGVGPRGAETLGVALIADVALDNQHALGGVMNAFDLNR